MEEAGKDQAEDRGLVVGLSDAGPPARLAGCLVPLLRRYHQFLRRHAGPLE